MNTCRKENVVCQGKRCGLGSHSIITGMNTGQWCQQRWSVVMAYILLMGVKWHGWWLKFLHHVCLVPLIHLKIKIVHKVTEPFFSTSTQRVNVSNSSRSWKGEWHFNYHTPSQAICSNGYVMFSVHSSLQAVESWERFIEQLQAAQNQTFMTVLQQALVTSERAITVQDKGPQHL